MSTRSELAGGRLSRGVKEVCAAAPRARVDGSPTPRATNNFVEFPPPRTPSPPAARARRGPGRGAQGPFANQKNRRAQNDLGRRPSTAQARRRGPWRRTRTTTRTRRATTGPAAPSGWTGSTPLRVRTVFFRAVMFLLHCLPPHRPLTPRVVSSLSPQLIRSCSHGRYTSTNARVLILSLIHI